MKTSESQALIPTPGTDPWHSTTIYSTGVGVGVGSGSLLRPIARAHYGYAHDHQHSVPIELESESWDGRWQGDGCS
jgi:hypothetical protein